MSYTVKQLADLAGVSRRTLHYYDRIGLLRPSRVADNGYRYYEKDALLRLQQILFYRELDFSLEEIGLILDDPRFELEAALQGHRQALQHRMVHLSRLIETIDVTLLHLQGAITMDAEQLFNGFDKETEERYMQEASERWDPELVQASHKRWRSYSEEQQAQIKAEGGAIYRELAGHIGADPGSDSVQELVGRWHRHLRYYYEPTPAILRGLGQGYAQDPTFRATFEQIDQALPDFLEEAIGIYCDDL